MDKKNNREQRMDKKTSKLVNDFIKAAIKLNPHLVKAYLFGSYAKGNFNENSDIDIALVLDKLKDNERFDFQVELMLLSSKFDNRIEPHPIAKKDLNLNNPFAAEILKTGIQLI